MAPHYLHRTRLTIAQHLPARLILLLIGSLCSLSLHAQTSLQAADLSVPSRIAPYYFSPNAFPIPDMLDGTVSKDLRIEVAADHFAGFEKDRTTDLAFRLQIPLFTDRVNLTLWMPIMEWYQNTLARQRTCRLQDTIPMRGHEAGDVYIGTDMWLLQNARHHLDFTLRAALRTASGGGYHKARYYDNPGYFFDATLAKPILLKGDFFQEIRFAASSGFLCWQTDNGRQNDAVMYGAMVSLRTRYFALSETFGGYTGWETRAAKEGQTDAHDCPMSLKTSLSAFYHHWELTFLYQYGLRDYPFHHFRLGVAYHINILKKKQ